MINSSENDWKVNVAKYKLDEFKQVRDVYLLLGCLQTTHLIERFFLSQTSEKNELTETNLIILRFLMHTLGSALQKVSKTATTSNKSLLNVFTGLLNKKQIQCWLTNDRYTFGHTKNIFDIIKFPPTATEIQSIKTYIKSLAQALNDVLKEYDLTDHLDLITFGEFDFTLYKKQALKGSNFKENILNYISLAEMLLQDSALDNSLTSFLLALTCIEGFGNNLHLVSNLPKNAKDSGEYLVSQRNTIAHANSLSELVNINVREDLNKICSFKEIFTNVKIDEIEDENNLSEKELEESTESVTIINVRKASIYRAAENMWSFDEITKEAFNNNKKLITIINSNCGTHYKLIQLVPHDDLINTLAKLASKNNFTDFDFITQHLRRKIDVNEKFSKKLFQESLVHIEKKFINKNFLSEKTKEKILVACRFLSMSGAFHILLTYHLLNYGEPTTELWKRLIDLGFNINNYFDLNKNIFQIELVAKNMPIHLQYIQIKKLVELIRYNTAQDEINWLSLIKTLSYTSLYVIPFMLTNIPEIFNATSFDKILNNKINLLTVISKEHLEKRNCGKKFLEQFISPFLQFSLNNELKKLFLPKKFVSFPDEAMPIDSHIYFSALYNYNIKINQPTIAANIKKIVLIIALMEEVLNPNNERNYPIALFQFLSKPNTFISDIPRQSATNYNLLISCFENKICISPSIVNLFNFKIEPEINLFQMITIIYDEEESLEIVKKNFHKSISSILYKKFLDVIESKSYSQSNKICMLAVRILSFDSNNVIKKGNFLDCLKTLTSTDFSKIELPFGNEEKRICSQLFDQKGIIWNIISFSKYFGSKEILDLVTQVYTVKIGQDLARQ